MALFRVSNERAQFDAAGNDARDQYGAGIRFTQGGNARVTTGSATNYNQGIPMSATGQVAIVDATAGLPAGTIFHNGLPISGDKVCVSRNATAVVSNGLPFDSAGAVAADINLDLNFVGATSMNSSVTFTRASSATFVGSNGLIQSATTNTPRFDYDPVTLAAKGLLIEEQRTNLLTWSQDFDNAAWTKTTDGGITVSANTIVAPDGTLTADKFIPNAVAGFHVAQQTYVFPNTAHSFSFYAKAGEYSAVQIFDALTTDFVNFNLLTGQVGSSLGYTGAITSVGDGWYRCTGTKTFAAGSTAIRIGVVTSSTAVRGESFTGDGTSGIFIWGAQLEAGAFPTSYIPTVASQVTRSADVASVNTLSPWYNATEGTLYAEIIPASPINNSQPQILWDLNDGTANNRTRVFRLPTSGTGVLSVTTGGASQVTNLGTGVLAQNSISKTAAAYKTNDFAEVNNSGTVSTTSSGTVSTASALRIGDAYSGNTTINGHIRRITYYPRRLSNAELQAITA